MLRILGTLVLLALFTAPLAVAQNVGRLAGQVLDDLGDPLPGANVRIEGSQLGAATNANGEYFIIGVPVGTYDITATFIGFAPQTVQNVQISSGYTTTQNFRLTDDSATLGEIVVEYERPLIQSDAIGVPRVITGEQIQNLPVRGVAGVAALQSGVVSSDGSNQLFVRGGRSAEVDYYVDGVKITGGSALAVNTLAIQEQEVLIGTIPARYGDAMSGVISITTRSGGDRFFGSVEAITSELLDDFGYNQASVSLGGPILPGRLSFFGSLQGTFTRDSNPYGVPTFRLSDEDFADINARPQAWRAINAQGQVAYVPLPTDIPVGTPLSEVIANPGNFGIVVPAGYDLDVNADGSINFLDRTRTLTPDRFTLVEQLGKNNPSQNFTFNGNLTFNPTRAVSLRLGGAADVGSFRDYSFARSLFAVDRFFNYDDQTYRGYLTLRQRIGDAAFYQIQGEYQNHYRELYPEGWNSDLRQTFFYGDADAPQNAVASSYYRFGGFNRSADGQIGTGSNGFFSNPGATLTTFQKRNFEQLRFSGSATAQLGLHQLEFGAEFEQQTRRLYQNNAILLSRWYNDGNAEAAPDGIGYTSYDDLPPAAFANTAFYYGYNYNGLQRVNDQDIAAFAAADGTNATRDAYRVAPYQPIYYAGYVQNKIEYRDLVINVGVRVDVFDNNTEVPRDMFSPYPIIRLENAFTDQASPLFGTDGFAPPRNANDDWAIYFNNAGNVVGYRDLDGNFYDLNGEFTTFTRINAQSGNIREASNANGRAVVADEFVAYTPQVTFMPRLGVSFPVTDRALFFASYNVTSQRPSEFAYTPFTDFDELSGGQSVANPGLKPERTTQYELGFRQRVGERAAFTLSGFYRTQQNKIQIVQLFGGNPGYSTFLNRDFTTNKGVEVEFDLRRTNNVSMNVNYTLSFAQGTGSDATTAGAIAWKGGFLPNFISPADFDRRHTANLTLDYRLGQGEGPELFGARVLENFGFNVLTQFRSGNPYTRTQTPLAINDTFGADRIAGGVNDTFLPSSTLINLRVDRSFNFGPTNFKTFLWVQNLLDQTIVNNVYRFTGQPDDDGFLQTPLGQEAIRGSDDPDAYIFNYNLLQRGPINSTSGGYGASGDSGERLYGLPRRIRLGVLFDF